MTTLVRRERIARLVLAAVLLAITGDRTITGEPSIRTCVIDGGASDRCRSAESG